MTNVPHMIEAIGGAQLDWRQTRRAQRKTLGDLAEKIESSPALLSRFERGECGLSVDRLLALAEALDIDCGDLPELWHNRGAA